MAGLFCISLMNKFCMKLFSRLIFRTGIFLANPCHQTTMLQLILLSLGKDNPRVTQIFRFQMYVMPGAFFALAFPILNTRLVSLFFWGKGGNGPEKPGPALNFWVRLGLGSCWVGPGMETALNFWARLGLGFFPGRKWKQWAHCHPWFGRVFFI